MNFQNLIIYNFDVLYHILKELDEDLNFKILHISNEKTLNTEIEKLDDYLIITKKNNLNLKNSVFLESFPFKLSKLIEKLNIEFLKIKFNQQSKIIISNYTIDLNSRKISSNTSELKLTEKEINTILYLSKKKEPIHIKELEKAVWEYQSEIETHTVETHIYRLRKKIFNTFRDDNFLISKKDGYIINQTKL
jgi:DNA-binding winged helix-turn-helix (wHTH) protein